MAGLAFGLSSLSTTDIYLKIFKICLVLQVSGNKNGKDDFSSLPLEILNIGIFNIRELRLLTSTSGKKIE